MTLSDETRTELRAAAMRYALAAPGPEMATAGGDFHDLIEPEHVLALLDEIDQLRAEAETARTAYRLTIRAMEGEIAENDGVIRTLRHQRDDAEAAVDHMRALHQPFCDQGCADPECTLVTCSCGWDEYPCPTIRALEGVEQ